MFTIFFLWEKGKWGFYYANIKNPYTLIINYREHIHTSVSLKI